jgi:hypothetical protein
MKQQLLLMLSFVAVGCSSGKYTEQAQKPQDAPLEERNWVVRERSHSQPPLWSFDFMSFDNEKSNEADKYFWAESGDVNDRIAGCDLARGRAKNKIAEEVSTFLESQVKETASGAADMKKMETNNERLNRTFKQEITAKANSLLSGVREVSQTWEERDYSKSGGAASVFNCKVLVKIPKKTLKMQIDKIINSMSVTDEVKKEVKNSTDEFVGTTAAPQG